MTEKAKHNVNLEKDFLKYSANKMTEKERNAFEKNLHRDAFDSDADEGFSTVSSIEYTADMKELKSRLHRKTQTSGRYIIYRYAAGLALIISVSLVFYYAANRKISDQAKNPTISESGQLKAVEELISEPQIEVFSEPVTSKSAESQPAERNVKRTELPAIDFEIDSSHAEAQPQITIVEDSDIIIENFEPKSEETYRKNEISETKASAGIFIEDKSESVPVNELKKVSGKVVSSEDYKPVMGATVILKGTSTGTVTDSDGEFELQSPESDSFVNLQVEFIGMEKQELLADAENELKIVLNPTESSLSEIVVIGYGTKKRADRTARIEMTDPIFSLPKDGEEAFEKYIRNNQIFPQSEAGVSKAKIVLEFLVDENGRPFEIKATQSPGIEFSDEAIRLLTDGPEWIQATPASTVSRVIIILSR